MRVYLDEKEKELVTVICNQCKRELLVENGILKEECIHVSHDFGYFGQRDGETHRFDLCEECYNKMIATLQISVDKQERRELL
ncbi:MAG: hypothetical protein IJO97_02870 [Lachnospiraceae bacterium]|nr:hypothetical protein [Lachnospiraceae bacterium]